MSRPALSLRGKFILILLGGAVLPLALLGMWLNQTAERSGERLLRERLESSVDGVAEGAGLRWLTVRGRILSIAELPEVQDGLRATGRSEGTSLQESPPPPEQAVFARSFPSSALLDLAADLQGAAEEMRILDASGDIWWRTPADSGGSGGFLSDAPRPLPVRLGVYDLGSGQRLGTLEVELRLSALLSGTAAWGGVAGSVLGVFEPMTGASLFPLSIDPALMERERFQWREGNWLSVSRALADPPLRFALAAPVAPFADPFRESARRNLWILAGVTLVVLSLATVLTRGTTRSLIELADAAEAVAGGDLRREVHSEGRDEVARLAVAFNSMTESLRRTLQELSQKRALAAVGEFASSLAHEVRNPLTSIRVDLQRIEEKLPRDDETSELMARTLRRIDALDRSVSGALQVARSGSVTLEPLNLRGPLKAAVQMALPAFQERDAELDSAGVDGEPIRVEGDGSALERLFLNLLLNAAQALERGGSATVAVQDVEREVHVVIRDSGEGIEAEELGRIFDPFFSSRSDGTGLGLPIAQRITQAHGGELSVESQPGVGTTVTVRLPQ